MINVDEEVLALSDERVMVAFARAEAEFGGLVLDYQSEEFMAEFGEQLKRLVVDDTLRDMTERGIIEPRVETDGSLTYTPGPNFPASLD